MIPYNATEALNCYAMIISCLPAVFGMVPFIKACLGTTLPMLGMVKHDNMKWVFTKGYYLLVHLYLQGLQTDVTQN